MDGQALLARPVEGFPQSTLREPHPGLHRCNWTHIRRKVAHVQALCLVEQVERAVQVALGLPDARHRDTPAIAVLREPGVFTKLLASQQVLGSGRQSVTLTLELT